MKLNDLVRESRRTWSIPSGRDFMPRDVELLYVATCLGGEAGELQNKVKKLFREKYYTKGHAQENVREAIKEEIADVLFYTSRIADILGVDMEREFMVKMEENVRRYGLTEKE